MCARLRISTYFVVHNHINVYISMNAPHTHTHTYVEDSSVRVGLYATSEEELKRDNTSNLLSFIRITLFSRNEQRLQK